MGYLFLILSVCAGAAKGYCGKRTSGYTKTLSDAVLANTIRMFLCIAVGFAVVSFSGDLSQMIPDGKMLWISLLSGVSNAVFVVSWLVVVKRSAYMLLDVFLMLGVLVPLIGCNLLFNESIEVTQWIGFCIILIAVMIMCSYNNSIKSKLTFGSFALMLLSGFASGVADFSQKIFVAELPDQSVAVFNFYTYVFAAAVLAVTFFVMKNGAQKEEKAELGKIFWFILIMAICLFANSFFKTLAAERLSAMQLYPLSRGLGLFSATIMSSVFFGEKATVKSIAGMILSFVGLLVINLL